MLIFFTIRLIVIALFLLLAIAVVIAGIRNRRRFSFFALFVVLIPVGAFGYFEYLYQTQMTTIQEATTKLTNDDKVTFNCQLLTVSLVDTESGKKTIDTGEKNIVLKYTPCKEIRDWMSSDNQGKATESQIKSLHIYSQELIKTAGVTDPNEVECLAIKNDATVFHYLGASKEEAIALSSYYKRNLVDSNFAREHSNCV